MVTARNRKKRLLEILDATLAEPPGARPAFLTAACGNDLQLRRELESLLELEGEADSFLPDSAVPAPGESATFGDGMRVGSYRVLEMLGRGGMGTVYKAVREDDFEKQVAIKLLQRDLVSEANVRRFHNERQILAGLEHPAIARLLDGGTTEDGRPYLVMEYVDGAPIDRYCDARRATTRERLELFSKVCSALAFAHRSLIVHRDLKPGNILITEDGTPKLLDFGIAKLLDPDDATRRDATGGPELMTPRYASPEQVLRQPITTASDIYALGTLLYRLLTGQLPCGLEGCHYGEIQSRIIEQEPVKPSVVVGRKPGFGRAGVQLTAESISHARDGDPAKLRRCLAGDVDAIVLKALRKEPRHRYSSARQLAEDIRRHLRGHPVAARKGTLIYRSGKFLRRHRLGVTIALVVLMTLAAFLVRERQRLEAERLRAERITEVLGDLLKIADPDRRETVVETLDQARDELKVLEADPDLRSDLLTTLGHILRKLGHGEKAWELWHESLELWRRHYPQDLAGQADRVNNLGVLYLDEQDYDNAESYFREALGLRMQLGDESGDMVFNLNNMATVLMYRGRYGEAEELYRRGLAIRSNLPGSDEHTRVSASLRSLGAVLLARGDLAAAEPPLREALEIQLREYGDSDTRATSVLDLLARVRFARGDSWEAEQLYRRSQEIRRQRFGNEHATVFWGDRNLVLLLLAEGELATARVVAESMHSGLRRTLPEQHWQIAAADVALGALLTAEGRYEEAEPCLTEGYEVLRAVRGEHSTYTRDARRRVYELYEARGRGAKAPAFLKVVPASP